MKALILALAPVLIHFTLPASNPVMIRADKATDAIMTALDQNGVKDDATKLQRGKRMFVWSYYESSWYADPKGYNDKGKACGVGQIHVESVKDWLPADWTCEKLRKDMVVSYRAMDIVMERLIKKCGSVRAGLVAYATDGACHDWYLPVVKQRCKLSGDAC
jgi:hypothetical protein